MDNGASSYRRFLDGDESAFNEIMEELFRSLVFFINGYYKESVNDMEDDGLVEDNKDFSQSGTTNLSSEFRIIFTTENGSQTIYSLSGYKLINETTKQETLLTADQLSNILDTLGLTITWEEEPK